MAVYADVPLKKNRQDLPTLSQPEEDMHLPVSVTADQNWMRRFNRAVVLDVLRRHVSLSRAELAAHTGLNRSTISAIINGLLADGLVQETALQSDRVGRPGMLLELNPAGGFAVGVELGVDFISLIVTDFIANVLWRQRVDVDPAEEQTPRIARAFSLTQTALAAGQTHGLRPLGIGLGVPGLVDLHQGVLRLAPNLGWKDVPLRQMWTQQFNLPVFVENEANASALGEYYFGVAREVNNMVYLSAGVGLGGGVLIGGKLFRGSHGYAAELGHMVIDPNGGLCACGRRGCLETLVSPRAVIRRVREMVSAGAANTRLTAPGLDLARLTFDQVLEAAHQGDPVAVAALQTGGTYLGIGIANLINIFDPQLVVLGGSLNRASAILLPAVEQVLNDQVWNMSSETLKVVSSAHGQEACVMGSVALVLDDILREPLFA